MRGVSHPAIILRGPTRYEQNKKGPFLSAPLTITFLATDADLGKSTSEKLASSMTPFLASPVSTCSESPETGGEWLSSATLGERETTNANVCYSAAWAGLSSWIASLFSPSRLHAGKR